MSDGRDGKTPSTVEVARFLGHGLTFAASTGLFLLVGWWADGRLGTTPYLSLFGAMLGAGLGFYNMYYKLVVLPRDERNDNGSGDGGE